MYHCIVYFTNHSVSKQLLIMNHDQCRPRTLSMNIYIESKLYSSYIMYVDIYIYSPNLFHMNVSTMSSSVDVSALNHLPFPVPVEWMYDIVQKPECNCISVHASCIITMSICHLLSCILIILHTILYTSVRLWVILHTIQVYTQV